MKARHGSLNTLAWQALICIAVFGAVPRKQPLKVLPRVGFVAQEQPLYRGFGVAEMLTVGRKLNPRWDDGAARARLARLGIPLDKHKLIFDAAGAVGGMRWAFGRMRLAGPMS